MKIVYNPHDGAPITGFIFNGILIDPHYPDGYALPMGGVSKGLVQYEDEVAEEILETYAFLQKFTPDQATEILERPAEPQFKCDHPGCDRAFTVPVALSGHKKSHKAKESEEPVVPSNLIPVAGGIKVGKPVESGATDATKNGVDKDGVTWYGEDVQVEKPVATQQLPKPGRAHFTE